MSETSVKLCDCGHLNRWHEDAEGGCNQRHCMCMKFKATPVEKLLREGPVGVLVDGLLAEVEVLDDELSTAHAARAAAEARVARLEATLRLVEWKGKTHYDACYETKSLHRPLQTCPACQEGHHDHPNGGGHDLRCPVRLALAGTAEVNEQWDAALARAGRRA